MENKLTAVGWLVNKLMKESTGFISLDALTSYTEQALEIEKEYTNSLKMDENKLYSSIEKAIIRWNIDGTKTAGTLTREIMSMVKNYKPPVHTEHRKIKDEWGNTDWRDTGEMGG